MAHFNNRVTRKCHLFSPMSPRSFPLSPISGRSDEQGLKCISISALTFHRMNCPPTKRLRGLNQDTTTAATFDDPFGDDAFSQDDLAEIDILASQAFSSTSLPAPASKPVVPKPAETAGGSAGRGRLLGRTSAILNRDGKFEFNSSNSRSKPARDPLGKFIGRNVISG